MRHPLSVNRNYSLLAVFDTIMKTLSLLTLFVGVSAILIRAEDTNNTPKTVDRLQSIVKRADATTTNAPPRATTNSVATTTNTPRYQDRLQTIMRRGTNQPTQTRTNKP